MLSPSSTRGAVPPTGTAVADIGMYAGVHPLRAVLQVRRECVESGACNPDDLAMQNFDRLLTKVPLCKRVDPPCWRYAPSQTPPPQPPLAQPRRHTLSHTHAQTHARKHTHACPSSVLPVFMSVHPARVFLRLVRLASPISLFRECLSRIRV